MTDPATRLLAAETDAALARERLSGTVAQIQARLDPAALAEEAKAVGGAATQAAVDRVRRNPVAVAGAAALAGLFLARHRIAAGLRRRKASRPLPAQPKKD